MEEEWERFQYQIKSYLRGKQYLKPLGIILLLIALLVVRGTVVIVGAGERAVVFSRISGTRSAPLSEGLHLLIPVIWKASKYDVKTQTYHMTRRPTSGEGRGAQQGDAMMALTSDGLPVELDLSVRYHPDEKEVARLHQNIGRDYILKVIRPQTRSIVRMVTSSYSVTDLYSGRREEIVQEMTDRLRERFSENNIILDEVLLRDLGFPDEFQAAIEDKQVAQQEAKRMDFVLEKAELERQRKIVEAEGEAAATQLKADALKRNPQLIRYEYVKNLQNDIRVIIADSQTIISLRDALGQ